MKSIRSLASALRPLAGLAWIILLAAVLALGFVIGRRTAPHDHSPPTPAVASDARPREYTCSMHPQIRLTDPKAKCPICFMDLIPVPEDAAGAGGPRELVMTEEAIRLAEIETVPVARHFPTGEVRLFGKVDFDETRLAMISAYFPARIDRLFVDYTGIPVRRGDHLAEIYSPELLAAQEELRQALAAVNESRSGSELIRASTEATLRASRDKLRLWGLTEEQIREIERTDRPMERLTIYSPIDGIVIERMALEGKYVQTGQEIYTVADLSRVWVRLEAYESQLPWVHYGQDVEFTTDSFPGRVFRGRVSFIDPIVSPQTRTARVRVNVDNTDGRIKPGMFVRALIRARIDADGAVVDTSLAGQWISPMHPEIVKDGPGECDICGMPLVPAESLGFVRESAAGAPPLVIPASAPLITGRRAVVYVRLPGRERPTFEGREVVLGPRAGDLYIVREGLAEGEQVVVHGAFKIDSSMQIAAKPSMMEGGDQPHAHGGSAPTVAAAPEGFLAGLDAVYDAYLAAQRSLADDDLGTFKTAAASLHAAVKSVSAAGLVGDGLAAWRRASGALLSEQDQVERLPDLDTARLLFHAYARAALDLQARFGHAAGEPLYRAYCPMAFDFKGAEWLQRGRVIDNPYFGDEMLRCGEIRAEYAPRAGGRP